MASKRTQAEQEEALAELREQLPPGSTIWTILRHVSASGMTRAISPMVITDMTSRQGTTKAPWDLTYLVTRAGIGKVNERHGGIKRQGCGMDMGFDLVYSISSALYPEGFECIGEHCPSNDHSNGDRDYTPGHVVHRSGGYAISQRWL